jgi:filamentous hemagglutinin family protein
MNKNQYRTIFNARRGMRMAVAETAASQSKSASGEGCSASMGHGAASAGRTVFTLAAGASLILLSGLLAPPVDAQIVADRNAPGNQRPTLLQTANGLPQVNIQTPSAAGVSRNTYSQFDVQAKGAILNNSRTDVNTQLGGYVQGNPWLATGSARVILNEVNSSSASQLRGYVEVAGPRAEVSVLDDSGKLLSKAQDGSGSGFHGDAEQLQYTQQLEQVYNRRILDILEPLVGAANVKAQVTAEVDFSQTESTTESHKPNLAQDSSAVRSQQTVESTNGSTATAAGVPGATSNQPPAQSSAPINGQPQGLSAAGQSGGGNNSVKKESIVNYEVDKTVNVVKGATGMVKRINAAVVINNVVKTDDKGRTSSTPLSDVQIEKMTALVRDAVGFSKDRGDSVNLMNAAFATEKVDAVDLPVWRQPLVIDMAQSLAWPLGTLALAALVLLGFVKPALKTLAESRPHQREVKLDATESEEPQRPQLVAPRPNEPPPISSSEQRMEEARQLTRDNPAAVANIVKSWINGEAPA